MAKRGTFGGTRFGSPTYGRTGFKRGFGRASFSRKADLGFGGGIAQEMMDFFKQMQSGKFGTIRPPQAEQPAQRGPRPRPVPGPLYEAPTLVQNPYWDTPETEMPGSKMGPPKPTGTPKTKKVKFRPKLTPGAR
jgi:hypothetical protein